MSLSPIQLNQLRKIASAHENNPAHPDASKFALVNPKSASALIKGGFIAIAPGAQPNAEGKVPARATAAGVALVQAAPAVEVTRVRTVVPEGGFQLEVGVPVPQIVRGGGRGAPSVYPFEAMEVGVSFLVPASVQGETSEQIAKRLSTAVSAANRKHTTITTTQKTDANGSLLYKNGQPVFVKVHNREFVVRAKDANGQSYVTAQGVPAARVFRTK